MLGQRDLVHPAGRGERVSGRTADKPGDRWRRRHGEPAQPGRLGDRRVADVRARVVGSVAAEKQPLRRQGRRGEPLVPGPGHLDAEVGAVARHRHDHRRAGDVAGGVQRQLARGHRQVQEEMVVAADECRCPRDVGRTDAGLDHRWQQVAEQHERAGPVPVVRLVAHLHHLGEDRGDVHRSVATHRGRRAAARVLPTSTPAGRARPGRRRRTAAPCRAPR